MLAALWGFILAQWCLKLKANASVEPFLYNIVPILMSEGSVELFDWKPSDRHTPVPHCRLFCVNTQKLSRLCYYLNGTVTEGIMLTLVYFFDMLTFTIKNSIRFAIKNTRNLKVLVLLFDYKPKCWTNWNVDLMIPYILWEAQMSVQSLQIDISGRTKVVAHQMCWLSTFISFI